MNYLRLSTRKGWGN